MNVRSLRQLFAALAAGDSLGSTSEFVPQREVPNLYGKVKAQGWPFKQVGCGVKSLPPGSPTDDTQMALCMVRSFFEEGSFDPQSIAGEFVSWMRSGPLDIGGTTKRTLQICGKSRSFWEGGLQFWKELPNFAANGSLMRNGIVAGMAGSRKEAFAFSLKHGMITHYAPLPQICCLAQTHLICDLLEGKEFHEDWVEPFRLEVEDYLACPDDPEIQMWRDSVSEKGDWQRSMEAFCREDWDMERFDPFRIDYTRGSGYCLLTLKIALWGLFWSMTEEELDAPEGFPVEVFEAQGTSRLAWVAMCGHDADTYAAVAGPLIAATGAELPSGFTENLLALEQFDQMSLKS
ncbi:MAG: ADP-ribosylglycohydrolase family protein [Methanothrix sp.]|nr:ADP-ribosylglycohydrolase family protein [Methanothrix sp.]